MECDDDGKNGLRQDLLSSHDRVEEEVECSAISGGSCPTASPMPREGGENASVEEGEVSFSRKKRRGLRRTYYVLAGFGLGMCLPAVLYSLATERAAGRYYLLPVAVAFVSCAVPISLWGIFMHVQNYWQPTLQKYVIRIIWMVPIYSITSLVELIMWTRVEKGEVGVERWCVVPSALRDCYEAYTVLNFFYFMLAFLELSSGESAAAVVSRVASAESRPDDGVRHPCPPYSCFCAPWHLQSGEFLAKCQFGILLYTTIMPLCALVLIADAFANDDDSSAEDASVKTAIEKLATPTVLVAAVQLFVANHTIYCLGLFYYVTHNLLAPCRPHLKFVAVKGLVFFTFFQNLGIQIVFIFDPSLARAFTKEGDTAQVNAALGSLEATLMCVEMLAFAVLHSQGFPYKEFPRVRDDDPAFSHYADASRLWLVAWGDYFASQKEERRLWRLSGGRGQAPRGTVSTSTLLFDVSDVHADTTATIRGIADDVAQPILRESRHSARVLREWRDASVIPPPSVAFARLAATFDNHNEFHRRTKTNQQQQQQNPVAVPDVEEEEDGEGVLPPAGPSASEDDEDIESL